MVHIAYKIATLDETNKPYHRLFAEELNHEYVWEELSKTMSESLWISDDLFEELKKFNFLLYEGTKANSSLIEFGKKNYINIAEMRTRLELLHRRDMLNLYDVSKFLKAKKISDGYSELPSNG
jgi:hypothetical protein